MITFGIFLFLTLIEYIIYRIKRSEIEELHGIGGIVADVAGRKHEYDSISEKIIAWVNSLKTYVLVPLIVFILILNLIIAYMMAFVWILISLAISFM